MVHISGYLYSSPLLTLQHRDEVDAYTSGVSRSRQNRADDELDAYHLFGAALNGGRVEIVN
jgi:hypothetical protein